MKQSVQQCVAEYQEVLHTRRSLQALFNNVAPCKVTIGGSYALKCQCAAFTDRIISDYDFILHVPVREDMIKIRGFLCLLHQHVPFDTVAYNDYHSVHFGKCLGLPVNIIISEDVADTSNFEDINRILEFKKEWRRSKDELDLEVYESWKEDQLPF